MQYNSAAFDKTDIVSFNVGGFSFQTNRSTFNKKNSNGSANYFELILNGDKIVQRDPQGYYFIDRDGDCMRVILAYLRTGRLDVPSIVTKSALIAEAQFYNIELPHIADDYGTINVKLLTRGIYTSNWITFFIKIVDSKYMKRGGDSKHESEGCEKYTYEMQGQNFVVHDGPHLNANIFDNGSSLVMENYGHVPLTFSPSQPLMKEISGEVPKTSYLVRASGTTVELLNTAGQVITTSTAEPDKNQLLVATLTLQDRKFRVKLFGHFMQVKNCAKGKTRRYPKANIWAKKVKQASEAELKDKKEESTA